MEQRVVDVLHRLRTANEATALAQTDASRAQQEVRLYQIQLEDLLDLKQKQANVAEARITRQSGTTITVFTIVTIIFLPASFMQTFRTDLETYHPLIPSIKDFSAF